MSLRTALRAQLRAMDEEAFVALANRGLYRRAGKDLESVSVRLGEETGDALHVSVGDRTVTFSSAGVANARCDCPSTTVCQHIIAAAMWLQNQAALDEASTGTSTGSAQDDAEASVRDSLCAELEAFGDEQLIAYAGKAAYRWAWQFVQNMEVLPKIGGERHISIELPELRMTFRYPGGPLDNLISEHRGSKLEKYRIAAVLAYRRANNLEIVAPTVREEARSGQIDFGKDHAIAERADQALATSRQRLRENVIELLQESVELGLSHLSIGTHERYATLAVWAQGAQYPRLALLLRRLADHVELLLERASSADEHRLLDEASLALALTTAIDRSAAKQLQPKALIGRSREQYASTSTIELVGLGASPWRSASGYVGLTMLFWSPEEGEFLSCTDARPEAQGFFNPIARYEAPGPWSGLISPAHATGRRLALMGARVSGSGRISGSEATSALIKTDRHFDQALSGLPTHVSWKELAEAFINAGRNLLSEPKPLRCWFALKVARFGEPSFDSARQLLTWPLFDREQNSLVAEIPYSNYSAAAIDALLAKDATGIDSEALVIARMRAQDGRLVAEPLSLLSRDAGGELVVEALYFPEQSKNVVAATPSLGAAAPGEAFGHRSHPSQNLRLDELAHALRRSAERGANDAFRRELDRCIATLRVTGFNGFTTSLPQETPAHYLLRANFVRMQYLRLLGDEEETESEVL
ncbi:hypothetical protein [Dyella mobilis]|uniref:SWIM-type domain-containing protein n=1 Tax=Dyella mobilis TaxID=1849582 RepID=A0ABS2KFK0_9GAMM|nr:hypothetical protein [Dyella mobilis]MBM7129948.1 hypothetical protein [Dyella mobilis]GLQ97789.1 hypothetical protein GCM10007863_22090 [Dyella mobilis]